MISRHEKAFRVNRNGRVDNVCIDHLIVVYVDDSVLPNSPRFGVNPAQQPDGTSVSLQDLELSLTAATRKEITAPC